MAKRKLKQKNDLIRGDFENHWQGNELGEIASEKIKGARDFFDPIEKHLKGKLLDVGCGDGVHFAYLQQTRKKVMKFFGVEISLQALKGLKKRVRKMEAQLVVGDGVKLPIKNKKFDVVMAFGVLAYTSNPFGAFEEMVRVVKKDGLVGVWIYPKQTGLGGLVFGMVRNFCQMIGPFGTSKVADLIVPFLGILPTRSKLSLANASWSECREVVLVNIAPEKLVFFEEKEIKHWFKKCDITIKHVDKINPITIWGVKN